jgi:hypothetical protein
MLENNFIFFVVIYVNNVLKGIPVIFHKRGVKKGSSIGEISG